MVKRISANCLGCGNEFYYKETRVKKYCSFRCYRDKFRSEEIGTKRECDKCGNLFIIKQTGQKLCSKKCSVNNLLELPRESAKTKLIACENCCKVIEVPGYSPIKHCSQVCYFENMDGKERPERRTGKYIECTYCKKEFYAKRHRINANKFIYCSNECNQRHVSDVLGGVENRKHKSIFS
jgi:hypothetical protein